MSAQTQIANTPYQWITAGSYGSPAVLPCYYPHYQYPNFDTMGRKKGTPHNFKQPAEDTGSQATHGTVASPKARRTPPWRNNTQQSSVSQPSIYSIVDAWRTYKSDNANNQSDQTIGANCQQQHSSPQHLHQSQWAPQVLWNPNLPLPPSQIRPQAAVFQPGQRLVNGYSPHSNYRIDKSSRYNLRSRHISTMGADQIVQSIEKDDVAQQLPGQFRGKRHSNRHSTPRRGPTPINTDIEPPTPPQVSQRYLEVAQQAPCRLLQPQKLLVLLDLNGTLVYRSGAFRKVTTKRPGVDGLISYLFNHHHVMLFTSATMQSAQRMATALFTRQQYDQLVAVRSREHLNLTPEQFRNKVQVYKDLNTIWQDTEVRKAGVKAGVMWDMTNTILIDDSIIKAKSHPHNLLQVSEFQEPEQNMATAKKAVRAKWEKQEIEVMQSVEQRLEELKWQSNVACLVREWQEAEISALDSAPKKPAKHTAGTVKEESQQNTERWRKPYPTPVSIDGSSSGREASGTGTDDEEYDPDQWRGVKLPTPTSAGDGLVGIDSKEADGKGRTIRSPSPVTEQHFQWLSLDDKKDTGEEDGGKGEGEGNGKGVTRP